MVLGALSSLAIVLLRMIELVALLLLCCGCLCSVSSCCGFTGAQLRHNDFWIFPDPSRTFKYNCDETFKTTSWTLMEKTCQDTHKVKMIMKNAFVFIPYTPIPHRPRVPRMDTN